MLALAAGVAAGVLATRYSSAPSTPPPISGLTPVPSLDDLQLSDDQRVRIQKIWEGVKDLSDTSYQKANRIQQQFDESIKSILTSEQMERYKTFHDEYQRQHFKLQGERDAAVKKAIEETKTLLSDDQRQKYDAILKSRLGPPSGTAPSTLTPPEMPKTAAKQSGGSVF